MVEQPGSTYIHSQIEAGGFVLDYASAGPDAPEATIVSFPGSAGLEMSIAKDMLAARYRVVEINPPGWGGKTDVDRILPQSELSTILAEAATQLVDGPFVLLGTSMGGTNALYASTVLGDRVRGIISEGGMAPSRPEDLRVGPDPAEGEYPVPPLHPRKPWATAEYQRQQMANRMAMFRWTEPDLTAEAAVEAVRESRLPILYLLGSRDEVLETSQKDTVAAALPHAQYIIVDDGGHDLQNTAPEAFVAQVEAFIDAVSSATVATGKP